MRALDCVLSAALAVGCHQGEHFISRVHDLLIAGVVAPGLLALALCTVEIGTENLGRKTAPRFNAIIASLRSACASRACVSAFPCRVPASGAAGEGSSEAAATACRGAGHRQRSGRTDPFLHAITNNAVSNSPSFFWSFQWLRSIPQ
jgi:hypothetical protein